MKRLILCLLVILFAFSFLALQVFAKGKAVETTTVTCNSQQRVQRMANLYMCFTNWGTFGSRYTAYGSRTDQFRESIGGCFNPDPSNSNQIAPSFEFPKGSDISYLYQGSLWIGAIVPAYNPQPGKSVDTVTSVGVDGWYWINEIWPDGPSPLGDIAEKSQKPGASCNSSAALADQEIISAYYDTTTPVSCSSEQIDPWDNRDHEPINLKITQHTYSWETPPYDNFVILDLKIKNIGSDTVRQTYLGFYMDTDIGHITAPFGGSQDDITGFLQKYDDDTVNIAWAADNDGDPTGGVFNYKSPLGAIGVKLLSCSNPSPQISYNWWLPDQFGGSYDWSPWKQANTVVWHDTYAYGRDAYNFPGNVLGNPGGDLSKYFIMSNGEIDYDQIYANVDQTVNGWLAPSSHGLDFANGYDTRFLFSFGSFDINPGDSISATLAFLAGDSLHRDVNNYQNNLVSTYNPDAYYANLNFSKLVAAGDTALSVYLNGYLTPPIGPPDSIWLANRTDDSLKIMWGSSSSPYLASFNIYRDDVKLDSNITDTFYVDTSVVLGNTYHYAVSCVKTNDSEGKKSDQLEVNFLDVPWNNNHTVPTQCILEQNHPNPFNASTEIRYYLVAPTEVKIEIYNILGQKVKTLSGVKQERGWNSVTWDGKDQKNSSVASGIYFYRIETKNYQDIKRMLLLK